MKLYRRPISNKWIAFAAFVTLFLFLPHSTHAQADTDNIQAASQNSSALGSFHSGLCLDVAGWSTSNGAKILQWECHGGANQQFEAVRQANGYYLIRSVHSGLCLDVAGWSTSNGANILQWECHGGANQLFRSQVPADDNLRDLYYPPVMIRSKHSGLCLDVAGWSTSNGAEIVQWTCHGGANQQFWIY